MMSNISLRQLRYLDALAQSLHFGRAAEMCAVTQPALSMQIQELEKALGTILMERTRQGAKLTAQGEEVARRAASILAAVRDLTDYAQHGGQVLAGSLHLGVIPTIAPYVLPKVLPHLRRSYPGLDLHLREAQTRYVLADLACGRLDAVLLSLPASEPEFESLELFDDPFVLVMPSGRPIPAHAIATSDLFENDKLLLLEEGHCLRDQALSFCGMKQVQNLNTFGMASLSTLVQMVGNGFGVTLLPKMSLETETARGDVQVLAFAQPEPSRKIGLVWRRSSPRKRDFIELAALIVRLAGNVTLNSEEPAA
jgi:LysR family transcriptional regulator, hydrogen peroxide-inducible genes activator